MRHAPFAVPAAAAAFAAAGALLLAPGCGLKRVSESAVQRLPLESKLDLIEAENDLFIAVDAVDEAATRIQETKEDYRNADKRIAEAKEALRQAEDAKDAKLVEIGKLSVKEAQQRQDFLGAWEDVMWAQLDVEKAKLELARARYEKARAQAVKKANVEGAQSVRVEDFDKQVREHEAKVKKEQQRAAAVGAKAEKVRGVWHATRRTLAQKTGGGQGSPWVE